MKICVFHQTKSANNLPPVSQVGHILRFSGHPMPEAP
jgi:hypothetical protein